MVEIVSARVRSIGVVPKLKAARRRNAASQSFAKPHEVIATFFERKKIRAAVYHREEIAAGSRLRVPCIVTEYSATTLIPYGSRTRVDSLGFLIIDVDVPGQ